MANEVNKRDDNRVTVISGIENDVDQDIKMARIDPTSKGILVHLAGVDGAASSPQTVDSGQKNVTTAGTQVQVTADTGAGTIVVKAKDGNTGEIYVGDSAVSSSDGFVLAAGDGLALNVDDFSQVYIDSSVDGEGVSFFLVKF